MGNKAATAKTIGDFLLMNGAILVAPKVGDVFCAATDGVGTNVTFGGEEGVVVGVAVWFSSFDDEGDVV